MKTYRTLNSVYEVDEEAKRVRRTEGINRSHDGHPDGEWRQYDQVIHTQDGRLLVYLTSDSVFRQPCFITSKATLVETGAGAQP